MSHNLLSSLSSSSHNLLFVFIILTLIGYSSPHSNAPFLLLLLLATTQSPTLLLLTSSHFLPSSDSLTASSPALRGLQEDSPGVTPNDSLLGAQVHLGSPLSVLGALNAQQAWLLSTGTSFTPIVLLSDGCFQSSSNAPLPSNELPYPRIQSISLPSLSPPTAASAGTVLAAAMAATTNNAGGGVGFGGGMAGVCWECQIICLKIYEPTDIEPTANNIRLGIEFVVKNNLRIAVIPDGFTPSLLGEVDIVEAAMQFAAEAGVLVVTSPGVSSSGTGPCDIDSLRCSSQNSVPLGYYPARVKADNVLVVGQAVLSSPQSPTAIDNGVQFATSNYGSLSVDIFSVIAPTALGVYADGTPISSVISSRTRGYGAALVAAVVGVLWGNRGCYSYTQIKDIIINQSCNCWPTRDLLPHIHSGSVCGGTIDMYKALLYSKYATCAPRTYPDGVKLYQNVSQQLANVTAYKASLIFNQQRNIPTQTPTTAKSCTEPI
eukprot:GHVQ01008642.1.p1 GENE.GHVQ01008642.1~~GHVQ01008642.1.p1  ORF type:complete len:490 (-),score=91.28 GHVQ01008642.1:65-1534(-)